MQITMSLARTLIVSGALIVASVATAQAQPSGLVRVFELPSVYWIDSFGIKHGLPDMETLHRYFGEAAITEISASEMLSFPKGQTIGWSRTPTSFNQRRDPQVQQEHIPVVNVRYERISSSDGRRYVRVEDSRSVRSHSGWNRSRNETPTLVRSEGSRTVYFVDSNGIRHLVRRRDQRKFFGDAQVNILSEGYLERMPQGHSISDQMPPEYYNSLGRTHYGQR